MLKKQHYVEKSTTTFGAGRLTGADSNGMTGTVIGVLPLARTSFSIPLAAPSTD
jgi:hypothetical protein